MFMLRATVPKHKRNRTRVKYGNIVADAAALRVSRVTLWRVLSGRWSSKSLLARYAALKIKQLKKAA
jgi:hypothetical protein